MLPAPGGAAGLGRGAAVAVAPVTACGAFGVSSLLATATKRPAVTNSTAPTSVSQAGVSGSGGGGGSSW